MGFYIDRAQPVIRPINVRAAEFAQASNRSGEEKGIRVAQLPAWATYYRHLRHMVHDEFTNVGWV